MRLKNFSLQLSTQIFKAFSDEARLRILNLLFRKGNICITDLELVLDFTQTKTSRHLAYLKNTGIVNFQKVDQWVFYSIKDEVYDLTSQIFGYMNKDASLKEDLKNYDILYSNRELSVNKINPRKLMD